MATSTQLATPLPIPVYRLLPAHKWRISYSAYNPRASVNPQKYLSAYHPKKEPIPLFSML
jgi:hypothetical protein